MGDERAQPGVGGVAAVERGEVKPRRREERDEPTDERCGGDGEGRALLRRVLVPAIVEASESALGDGPARAIPWPCTAVSACSEKPCSTASRRAR